MRLSLSALLISLSLAAPLAAEVVVVTDADFAPLARELAAQQPGADLRIVTLAAPEFAAAEADLILTPDESTAADLVARGRVLPESRMTYAMGRSGTGAAVLPREAFLTIRGAENPGARAFLEHLLSPEAWDLIVSGGFGAH